MTRLYPCTQAFPVVRRALVFGLALPLLAAAARGQATSTQSNPTTSFSTPGTKQVTLQACNKAGCNTVTHTVVVLDPKPQITSANIPILVGVGQAVPLQATATGRPPRSYKWTFTGLGGTFVVNGSPATWTAPSTPGVYLAHLDVTNADGAASSVPVTVNVVPSTFVDVPPTYWAWKFIENMYSRGVFSNCSASPLLFCPEDAVTRGQMAIILLRAKMGAAYVPPACTVARFGDVPCSSPLAPWVNELVARGVTAGCGGGNYCPDSPVTRAQMAVFLLATKEGPGYSPDPSCLSAPFNDMPCFSPFAIWVRELVTRGVTAGCGGGAFCPADVVNRAQMSIFISTMFNLPPP
jgi:hypothetical protein